MNADLKINNKIGCRTFNVHDLAVEKFDPKEAKICNIIVFFLQFISSITSLYFNKIAYMKKNQGGPKSQSDFNTVQFLLNKNDPPRKRSQYNALQVERPNFYSVVRVYINSLTSSQIRLYYSKFTPKTKQGTICIIHGYGQTTDDYIEMAEYFAKNRFVVNMIDLRSFGYSGGNRVNQPIQGLLSDIQNLLRRCCSIGLPTYVIAHGFGSLLLFALLQQNPKLPISGIISLSPLFTFPFFNGSTFVGKSLMWMVSSIWPDLLLNNKINPTSLTNNLQKVKDCIDGVFNYQFTTVQMIQRYSELSQKVLNDAYKFQYPLYILFGKKNTTQSIGEVKIFYNSVSSKEKSSFLIDEGYHQLFKDNNAEQQVYNRILEWILDEKSNKNDIKWGNTSPLNLKVIKKMPKILKYLPLLIIPIILLLLRKIKNMKG